MPGKIYFKEEQHFTSMWIWMLLVVGFIAAFVPQLHAYYQQTVQNNTLICIDGPCKSLLIGMGLQILIFGFIFFLFKKMKLVTEVRTGAFYYRYPPFINKEKRIGKEEIDRYEIREYKPIREYGGWGVRQGIGKAGKAFNVKGKIGLQLYLKTGKKIMFGTQRGDALLRAMNKMMKEE